MKKATMLGLGIYTTDELETIIDIDSFSSHISILDYTSVIIEIEGIVYEYTQIPEIYGGLCWINNDNQSAKLVRDMNRRRNEIIEILKQGNNVFVILPSEQNIYINTGKKEYSGTGKNRATTNYVDIFNLLSFLPVDIECIKAVGRNINYIGNNSFDIIKANMMNDFQYKSYISKGKGTPLMKIANTTKNVGMVIEYESGKIVLLPDYADEELYEDEEKWDEGINRCIHTLIQLDVELKQNVGEFELPAWAKDFLVPNESEELEKLNIYTEEVQSLKNKIVMQERIITEIQKIKLAFVATGDVLEKICKDIFLKLGFEELDTEYNRSDLVLKYDKKDVVVEIKGLTKSAGEKNAAQLEKWVSEHIEQYGKQPKAVLLVNAFRNIRLDERNEDVFPKQMLKYATSREQCLLSTTQFVCLYLDCMANPAKKKSIIDNFLDTVGVYKEYNNIKQFIQIVEEVC